METILAVLFILLISLTLTVEGQNETFSISGSVQNDTNGNGKYDWGDIGIPDVHLCLLNSKKESIAQTYTDSNGNYSFAGLTEGDYYLEKNSGYGWRQILPKPYIPNKIKLNNKTDQDISRNFLDETIPVKKGLIEEAKDLIRGAISYFWPGVVWFLVFVFMAIAAIFTVIRLKSTVGTKKKVEDDKECSCNYLLIFVLIGTTLLGWTFYVYGKPFYIIPLIGITCLAIPLILSISADYNIGSKLDNGEIRKSIVISLTVVYIIFLAISFEKSIDEKETNIQSYDADFAMKMDKEMKKDLNISQIMNVKAKIDANSEVFATPERLNANFSSNIIEVVLTSKRNSNSSKDTRSDVPLPSSSANASSQQMIPEEVMATFTKNFLYVYILIILFYFGSRFVDEYRTSSTLEKYLSKGNQEKLNIDGITAARFALGDIGAREYKETIDALGYRADKTIEVSKYALSVAISDVEKKYEAWKEADAHEKETIEKFKVMQAGIENHTVSAGDLENARAQKEDAANQLKNAKSDFETAIANVDKIKKELMDAENKKSG